jgi:hypothetical protein
METKFFLNNELHFMFCHKNKYFSLNEGFFEWVFYVECTDCGFSNSQLSNAASYFSAVDSMRGDWATQESVIASTSSYLVRGLMHEFYSDVKKGPKSTASARQGRMHQFVKPRLRAALLDEEKNRCVVRSAFSATPEFFSHSTDELFTVTLPVLGCICGPGKGPRVLNGSQASVLSAVTSPFGKRGQRNEFFDEKGLNVEDDFFQVPSARLTLHFTKLCTYIKNVMEKNIFWY